MKAVAHSVISFIFHIFPQLCKIIRNERKICWMPSHSLLEQEKKAILNHSLICCEWQNHSPWWIIAGRTIWSDYFLMFKLQIVHVESTKVWIIFKNLKKILLLKMCICMTSLWLHFTIAKPSLEYMSFCLPIWLIESFPS